MFAFTTAGRLIGIASAAALLLLGQGITATPGSAQTPEANTKPNFTSATATLDFQYDYMATWTETDLKKDLKQVDYELVSQHPSSTWQCFIRKSATDFTPKGQPQPGGTDSLRNTGTVNVMDGSAKGMLSLRSEDVGSASCSAKEYLCRIFVSYADNTLTDMTNRVSAPPLPNISTKIPPPTDKTLAFIGCYLTAF